MKDSWEQGPVSRTWAAGSELLATNLSPTVSWPHDLDRSVNFSGSFSRCVARNPRLTSNYARIVLESRLGGRVGSLAVKHFTVAVAVPVSPPRLLQGGDGEPETVWGTSHSLQASPLFHWKRSSRPI